MGGEDAVAQKGRTRKALLALVAGLDWVCACVVSRCWAVVKHGHRGFGHTKRLLVCLLAWRRFGLDSSLFCHLAWNDEARQDKGRGHLQCLRLPVPCPLGG